MANTPSWSSGVEESSSGWGDTSSDIARVFHVERQRDTRRATRRRRQEPTRGGYSPAIRWLVVHAHPDPDSFSSALREAARTGLEKAGHEVRVLDLYDLGFWPVMSEPEHRHYETVANDHPDTMVTEHIALVRWAEGLVFVYPTWWASLPAMLKGWLDRVLLPDVAFRLNPETRKIEPGLSHVRRLVGITTYGAPRWQVAALGDGGRTIIGRTVRLVCRRPSRLTWLWLDRLDGRTEAERASFLRKVEDRMAKL